MCLVVTPCDKNVICDVEDGFVTSCGIIETCMYALPIVVKLGMGTNHRIHGNKSDLFAGDTGGLQMEASFAFS